MPNENSVIGRYHGELGDSNWGSVVSSHFGGEGVKGHFRNNPMDCEE